MNLYLRAYSPKSKVWILLLAKKVKKGEDHGKEYKDGTAVERRATARDHRRVWVLYVLSETVYAVRRSWFQPHS
jgi:hypothetical protein